MSINKNLIAQNNVTEFQNKNGKAKRYGGIQGEFFTEIMENNPESFLALDHNGTGFVSFTEHSCLKLILKKNKQINHFLVFKIEKVLKNLTSVTEKQVCRFLIKLLCEPTAQNFF